MRYARNGWLCALASAALSAVGCSKAPEATIDSASLALFAPLPDIMPAKSGPPTDAQVNLGRMLYYDARLSRDQKISCNTCHDLSRYGVDAEPTSDGFHGQRGTRNSPTVYNAAAHFVQFWDGRAADVEEQAKGPVLNPVEMALPNAATAVRVLKSIPEYVAVFQQAFPEDSDPVTFDNAARAIGAFERKLVTPGRWDKFLKGDQAALTPTEKAGFNTFIQAGCQACHAGALLGGNFYQKLGAVKAYPDQSDLGRNQVTKTDGDKMLFKVPSLRNIEKTGPYFHNGKVPTLDAAVTQMGEYQLGRQLKPEEVASIVTWMKSLTGEIPASYIQQPELPKSTAKTPKPGD
jgi:cytochrome c peroxidase